MSACEEEEPDFSESITSAKEISVPELATVNEVFDIDLVVFGSSGCAEFSKFTTTENGDTTIFALFQRRDNALSCTANIIDIPVTISYQFRSTGKKYLKFNAEASIFSDFETTLIDSLLVVR